MRAAFVVGALIGLSLGACFSEPEEMCSPGAEGCACVDLQCETGLTCEDGRCVAPDGTSGNPTTDASGPTTDDPSTTSTTGSTTAPMTTVTSDDGSTESGDTSSTGGSLCGNGVLDDGEECDGTEACTDCELDNYDCNPLNNAGCAEGAKCSFNDQTQLFWCLPFDEPPPGQLHDYSCYYNGAPQDQWCDVGLACMPGAATGACDDGGCCVEFCDIFDNDFECAQAGDECVVWFLPDAPDGLEWLGVCITP